MLEIIYTHVTRRSYLIITLEPLSDTLSCVAGDQWSRERNKSFWRREARAYTYAANPGVYIAANFRRQCEDMSIRVPASAWAAAEQALDAHGERYYRAQ